MNRVIRRLIVALPLLLAVAVAGCQSGIAGSRMPRPGVEPPELEARWTRLRLSFPLSSAKDMALVTAATSPDGKRLLELQVAYRGYEVIVPQSELADLDFPLLGQLSPTYDPKVLDGGDLSIEFMFCYLPKDTDESCANRPHWMTRGLMPAGNHPGYPNARVEFWIKDGLLRTKDIIYYPDDPDADSEDVYLKRYID